MQFCNPGAPVVPRVLLPAEFWSSSSDFCCDWDNWLWPFASQLGQLLLSGQQASPYTRARVAVLTLWPTLLPLTSDA